MVIQLGRFNNVSTGLIRLPSVGINNERISSDKFPGCYYILKSWINAAQGNDFKVHDFSRRYARKSLV